ncbi:PIN domain-containing protein [Candidatus Woesearchaeota archaeon]|nr:PIN domain-containing protein [Candidatus Woesearchaeota archaeon]
MKFFLDTYALVEIIKGNPRYRKYVEAEIYTCVLNLYELFYNLLKDYSEDTSKAYFYQYYGIIIPIKDEHIFSAAKMKLKNKNISYADALGYAISSAEGMRLLTGDKEFKELDNVEFVK